MPNRQYVLPVTSASGGSGGGGVSSFNARTGAVTPQTGDYTVAQITGAPQFITVTLTSAQILNLDNTVGNSVQILPPCGAGNMYIVYSTLANMQFNSVPYATGTGSLTLNVIKGGVSEAATPMMTPGELKSGASSVDWEAFSILGTSVVSNNSNASLAALISNSTKYTAGNSPVVVTVQYQIVAVS